MSKRGSRGGESRGLLRLLVRDAAMLKQGHLGPEDCKLNSFRSGLRGSLCEETATHGLPARDITPSGWLLLIQGSTSVASRQELRNRGAGKSGRVCQGET